MTDKHEEYRVVVSACALVAAWLQYYDVPGVLNDIELAEAMGAIFDPTLYRENHKAMLEDKEMLESALPLWRMGKKLKNGNQDGTHTP